MSATLASPDTDDLGQGDELSLRAQHRRRQYGLLAAVVVLVLFTLLSIAVGSLTIGMRHVIESFTDFDPSNTEHLIVRQQRIPRTVLAIVVGVALGIAGALMQGLTRNPLADPGLLGVSAGAAFAMTMAVGFLSITSLMGYVWFSFLGAVVATVVVYALGSLGGARSSPITLALAGVAVGAVLSGLTTVITLLDMQTFASIRVWQAGSLAERGWDVILVVTPFIVAGLVIAAAAARGLNAIALGDDLATALGANQRLTNILVVVAITLLCGAATAAVGPIWFLGLMVPHVARWIVGPDQRWILCYSALVAPILMLAADILGRVVVRPDEIQAGIVTAFLGAPVLIWLVRRRNMSEL